MKLKNLDTQIKEKSQIMDTIRDAIRNDDSAALMQGMTDWQDMVQEQVRAEYEGWIDSNDNKVLSARGVRALTSEETKYYNAFLEANRQTNFKDAIAQIDVAFPETIIDTMVDDISEKFPLLGKLQFVNTTMLTKWILPDKGVQQAKWGAITAAYEKELEGGVRMIDTTMCKLTALMFLPKDLLDMGPAWVDRYVRAVLVEAQGMGLEMGIVAGTGKEQPIGMIKDISDTASVVNGAYPDKEQIKLDVITPHTIGAILSQMAVSPSGRTRTLGKLLFLCNPLDYFTKVMPSTTVLVGGVYANNVMPYPMEIIQSAAVPQNTAVLVDANGYFVGIGARKRGTDAHDDSYKFADDVRTYAIKMHAVGRAYDDNYCKYLDITDLESAFWANSPAATFS